MNKKIVTTVDKSHKEYIYKFNSKYNNKYKLINKKTKLLKELNNLKKIDYKNYSNKIIEKKANLLQEIENIENNLKLINSNIDESLYFNNTIDYLSKYYSEKKEVKIKKKIKINDFFNKNKNKNIKKKNNKSNILKNYLSESNQIQTNNLKNNIYKPKYCSQKYCKGELILHLSDGYIICNKCGICSDILLDSDKPNYKNPIPDCSTYAYKRLNHLNEWLAQFQAKESTDIPDFVYEQILKEIKKRKLINKRISAIKMRDILKKLDFNKYYEHIQHIINKVTGAPPPKITKEIEEKLRWMFREMQEPFALYCPKTRKNFLNYSFTLRKCFELLELNDYLPCFSLLKSNEKLKEQDIIWEKICNHIGWTFIPSI